MDLCMKVFSIYWKRIQCKQCDPISYIKLINWSYVDINGGKPEVNLLKSAIIQY